MVSLTGVGLSLTGMGLPLTEILVSVASLELQIPIVIDSRSSARPS